MYDIFFKKWEMNSFYMTKLKENLKFLATIFQASFCAPPTKTQGEITQEFRNSLLGDIEA